MKTPQLWSITVCFIVVSVEFQIETGLNWGSLGLVIWIYRFYWRPLLCKVDHFKLGIRFFCSFEFWIYEKNSCIILNRSMKPSRLNLFWFARKIFSENFWCIIIFLLHGGESKNFLSRNLVLFLSTDSEYTIVFLLSWVYIELWIGEHHIWKSVTWHTRIIRKKVKIPIISSYGVRAIRPISIGNSMDTWHI